MSKSLDLWYLFIYRNATVPGLNLLFLTPVVGTAAAFGSAF